MLCFTDTHLEQISRYIDNSAGSATYDINAEIVACDNKADITTYDNNVEMQNYIHPRVSNKKYYCF
jgi:hypothetical protein